MPNTYTQLHIHFIFAVQNRTSLIKNEWQERLNQYITAIIQNRDHKLLAINGMPDHVHVLIGMRPTQSISSLMQEVKRDSSEWINKQKFCPGQFSWQQGYGAFSYSKSQLPAIISYILEQEKHHHKKTFITEYKEFLDSFGIEYDERYIFHPLSF